MSVSGVKPRMKKKHKIAGVLFTLSVIILSCLCLWQVVRGYEKQDIERIYREGQGLSKTINQMPNDWKEINYQELLLTGQWYDGPDIVVENRSYMRRIGVEVWHPFKLVDGSLVLVNRGWFLNYPFLESITPDTKVTTTIKGVLYRPSRGFILGENLLKTTATHSVVQYHDPVLLSKLYAMNVSHMLLVLDNDDSFSGQRIWKPYVIDARKHFGYALQWGGLALTLLIFGFIWLREARQ